MTACMIRRKHHTAVVVVTAQFSEIDAYIPANGLSWVAACSSSFNAAMISGDVGKTRVARAITSTPPDSCGKANNAACASFGKP